MGPRHCIAAVVVGLVIMAGCSNTATTPPRDPAAPSPSGAPTGPATNGAALSTACGAVQYPPLQVSSHLVGDAEPPSEFSSVPATSGWHTTRVPEAGVVHNDLRDADIVSALENGIVVAAVHPDLLDDQQVLDTATQLLDQFPDRFAVVAYDHPMETPVALLTWGRLARCDTLDATGATTFVLTHRVTNEDH